MKGENVIKQNTMAYNGIADLYANEWKRNIDGEITSIFLEQVGSNSAILDVGCGPGHYSDFFISKGHSVFSVDISMTMLKNAREDFKLKKLACMDIRFLSIKEKLFDALWVCASFPHIPCGDTGKLINGFSRVLKPGGILFLNAIIGDKPHRIETKEEINIPGLNIGRFFQWYPSSDNVERILKEKNFKIINKIEKSISSNVLVEAKHKVNKWANFLCVKPWDK